MQIIQQLTIYAMMLLEMAAASFDRCLAGSKTGDHMAIALMEPADCQSNYDPAMPV